VRCSAVLELNAVLVSVSAGPATRHGTLIAFHLYANLVPRDTFPFLFPLIS